VPRQGLKPCQRLIVSGNWQVFLDSISNVHLTEGRRRILVPAEYRANLSADWFVPDWWGINAEPVSAGGRGSAWFLHSPLGDAVLRQYRRGGFVARLSESSYFFTGYEKSRSFAEFRLLQALRLKALPVPEPLAAMVERVGLVRYKAWIILRRLAESVPLPEASNVAEPELWSEVGRVLRRFHDAGLNHVDLNCDNILVAPDGIYLIDFDRCELRENASAAAGWKVANINRLRRSVKKRCKSLDSKARERVWRALLEGYRR